MLRIRKIIQLLFSLLVCAAPVGHAGDLTVAVAANFREPMLQIATDFEQRTGHRPTLIFGSSGKFFAQISHGAPFDCFLSADQTKPAALVAAGLAVAGSQFTYAIGAIALWSANPDWVDDKGEVLTMGSYRNLAIANPELAPYGVAAMDVLRHLNLTRSVRLVQGENIAQTYQFVSSGNADIGFVALSQIMAAGRLRSGSAWRVPAELYSPIRQDAVLLTLGKENPAAVALLSHLKRESAIRIIESFSYQTQVID